MKLKQPSRKGKPNGVNLSQIEETLTVCASSSPHAEPKIRNRSATKRTLTQDIPEKLPDANSWLTP
jgi:hypothetical protein